MSDWKNQIWEHALPHVQGPGQYVGGEWNMARKDPAAVALRVCLAFPDNYSVGMSYTGLHVLYGILNRRADVYAERVFAPWSDMEARLRRHHIPLCSLETATPLREFDVLGFSLQYEMCFTNVLLMLDLGGIPLLAKDRGTRDPIVVAGGGCAFNPEPLADFVDLFVIGDGEERIEDLATACIALKRQPATTRAEAMAFLMTRVPNSYAPALYEVEEAADGRVKRVAPRRDLGVALPARIEAAQVEDLDKAFAPDRPLVPFVETVHDRISIEIMRGCSRGCRFCQAGMLRRPARARSIETILGLCEAQYAATGHSEISLASLSTSDYPNMMQLVKAVSLHFSERKVSVSLPSLRVDDQLQELPGAISGVRKSTLTVAPEAGTDRLRRVINKEITEEDLLRGVQAAYAQGWNHVKLYFMVGLPTETDEDVVAIAKLAERVSQERRAAGQGPALVNLSVAPFVPKPHTPFQWEPMASRERFEEIRALLRRSIRMRSVNLRMHLSDRSFLEGVFARGDRRVGRALLEAYRLGCRFDAWDETFDYVKWRQAFEAADVAPEAHVYRAREVDEVLPWSHIGAGVSTEFLARERAQALRAEFTPDCRRSHCHACGVAGCKQAKQME